MPYKLQNGRVEFLTLTSILRRRGKLTKRASQKDFSDWTDEDLMCRLFKHDTAAFDELYRRYSRRMLTYFYRMLGQDGEKAQDFLQDLFVKIIEKHQLFRAKARFSTWIFTIAHNMCKNEYRRLDVRKIMERQPDLDTIAFPTTSGSTDIGHHLDYRALENKIMQALNTFDEYQRSSFILRFQEHLSIKEISHVLGCSEGTTKSRLFYVTKRLSKIFKDLNPNKSEVSSHATK